MTLNTAMVKSAVDHCYSHSLIVNHLWGVDLHMIAPGVGWTVAWGDPVCGTARGTGGGSGTCPEQGRGSWSDAGLCYCTRLQAPSPVEGTMNRLCGELRLHVCQH